MKGITSLPVSFFLPSILLLSTVIGYSSPTDSDVDRIGRKHGFDGNEQETSEYHHTLDLGGHALGHQQKTDFSNGIDTLHGPLHGVLDGVLDGGIHGGLHGVNQTLWAAVVNAALRKPFDWIRLSHALDTLEQDFQKRLSGVNSHESEVHESEADMKKSSRPTFTYHRVLTFLRNGSRPGQRMRLSAIAAVSASAIRPSPSSSPPMALHHDQLDLKSRTTSSLITNPLSHHRLPENAAISKASAPLSLEEEILSRLLEEQRGNNVSEDDDYGHHLRRNRKPLPSSSRRHLQERWRKLSGHFQDDDQDGEVIRPYLPKTVLNFHHHQNEYHQPFKYPLVPLVHHQKRHEPIQ